MKLVGSDSDRARLDRTQDFDCSWGLPGVGRFRVNVSRQRSSFMIVMRVIPFDVPSLDGLHLPATLSTIAESERGLVIVSGVSGGGKTSTVAAMLNHVNRNFQRHIVTIEDPIEFLHRDVKSSVTQREVGVDTASYLVGLGAALRQDPDVIVLGELTDSDTMDRAVKAAEMGHLVIAAMTTYDATQTVARLLAMYRREERQVGRLRLAGVLRAVISQRLVPGAEDGSRVPAVEILVASPETNARIEEPNRLGELREVMAAGGEFGMQTLEQHLSALAAEGSITPETARAAAAEPDALDLPRGKGRKARS
jgi:twitching motility protein PilT